MLFGIGRLSLHKLLLKRRCKPSKHFNRQISKNKLFKQDQAQLKVNQKQIKLLSSLLLLTYTSLMKFNRWERTNRTVPFTFLVSLRNWWPNSSALTTTFYTARRCKRRFSKIASVSISSSWWISRRTIKLTPSANFMDLAASSFLTSTLKWTRTSRLHSILRGNSLEWGYFVSFATSCAATPFGLESCHWSKTRSEPRPSQLT